jgi:hypothetical protein
MEVSLKFKNSTDFLKDEILFNSGVVVVLKVINPFHCNIGWTLPSEIHSNTS